MCIQNNKRKFTEGTLNTIHKNEKQKTLLKQSKTIKSGRIYCEFCEKKFNKIETFNKHMITNHKSYGGDSSPPSQKIKGGSSTGNENENASIFNKVRNIQESMETEIPQEEMRALGSL